MANWWDEAPTVDKAFPEQRGSQKPAPAAKNWWDEAPIQRQAQQPAPAAPMELSPGDIESMLDDPAWAREVLRTLPAARRPIAEQQFRAAQTAAARAKKSGVERFIDAAADSATFGIRDELAGGGAALGSLLATPFLPETYTGEGPGVSTRMNEAYIRASDDVRAQQRANEEDFGFTPKVLGAATVGPSKLAAGVLPSLRATTPAIVEQTPNFLARVGQSAKVGAGFGGVSAAASYDSPEDETFSSSLGRRLLSGVEGAAVGGIAGPVLSEGVFPAIQTLGKAGSAAAKYAHRALQSARNPEQDVIESIAGRLMAAAIDPIALRASITPTVSANLRERGMTEEHLADIISRQMSGETAATVAQDHGIAPATARRYFIAYRNANPTPMNIVDAARELAGPGASAPVTRLARAAYSLAGDKASAPAAEALLGRRQTAPGRVANIIRRSVGGEDFEPALSAARQNLKTESDAAYRAFHQEPDLASNQLDDLMQDPLFRRANIQAQRQARVEAIRANQEAANAGRPPVEPVPDVNLQNEVFSPKMLDLIQRQLRIAGEGAVSNPNNARHAQNLRQVFLDRIEQHYPSFRGIRKNYAEGKMEETALESGSTMATRLGAPAREVLGNFDKMTPAQQELLRIGFARKLLDMAANSKEGAAVANQFQTPAVREIVERLFPAGDRAVYQRGQDLLRNLRREAITTATENATIGGSRTAELQSDMGRMMEQVDTAANVMTGRYHKILDNLAKRLTTEMSRQRYGQMLRILTETDPSRLLPILNQLAAASQSIGERQAYFEAIRAARRVTFGRVSAPVGTVGSELVRRPQEQAVGR